MPIYTAILVLLLRVKKSLYHRKSLKLETTRVGFSEDVGCVVMRLGPYTDHPNLLQVVHGEPYEGSKGCLDDQEPPIP